MLKIGDFARLGQVSVVTLRHYDECGLLTPSWVDSMTGYRYYSVALLPRLNRILALKDLGFSLEQIGQILEDGLSHQDLHEMLMRQHAQVEAHIANEQARLARIAARLRQIEMENTMSQYDVILKTVPAMTVVSQRVTIPTNDEVPKYLGDAYQAVWRHINNHNAVASGSHFTVWHQSPDVLTNEVVDAVVPIQKVIPSEGDVEVHTLEAVQVASAVHHGDFDDFVQLHTAILKWMEDNGYEPVGSYREIYIKHDTADTSDSTTEVQFPIQSVD